MRPQAVLRQGPIFFAGDVDPQPAAEILEDELGLRPGGEGNYRDLPQTQDEAHDACPVRAQGAGRRSFLGAVFGAGVGASLRPGRRALPSLRSRSLASIRSRAWPDVDSHPAAEILEDELGCARAVREITAAPCRRGTRPQSAMPARFAPKAPAVGCFWAVSGPGWGRLLPRRAGALYRFSGRAPARYPAVFRGVELLPLSPARWRFSLPFAHP